MELADILKISAPSNVHIMQAIAKLVEFNINSHEEITNTVNESKKFLEQSVFDIKSEINKINLKIDGVQKDVANNSSDITSLQAEVNYIKQSMLQRDVLVTGFPNNLADKFDVIEKLNNVLNFGVDNIESSYMKAITIKRSGRSGNGSFHQCFLRFKSLETKNIVMSYVRSNGPLKLKQLYPSSTKGEITINVRDKLTPANNIILKQLIELKNNKLLKYCWFRHNNVYVKVKEDDQPKIIWTMNDVTKLKQQ